MSRFVNRKDLARILEVSVDSIARNEQRLGLDIARRDVNARLVRYDAAIATRELKRRQQWPKG